MPFSPNFLTCTAAIFLALVAPANAAGQDAPARIMSIAGTGEVRTEPDIAIVTLGVVSIAKSARKALSANNTDMAALLTLLKGGGIAERDLQTSGFSIQPRYRHKKRNSNGDQEPPEIIGYQVSNQLTATVRDLDSLGEILDMAVSTGSNQVSGIRFSVDKPQVQRDEARRLAVADATRKANVYADAAGISLGSILTLNEQSHVVPPRPVHMARTMAMEASSAPVPIARGEQSITVQVHISWEIK